MTPEDREALELELDTTQKPMTPFERSKALVERAREMEAKLQRAADSLSKSDNESKSKNRGGQPQAVTDTDVADAVGVSRPTIARAVKHVEAVTANPDLKDVPQDVAIRDGRWYEDAGYPDFVSYCTGRWGYRQAQVYRLIEGAEVVDVLYPIGETPAPANEGQARELHRLIKQPEQMVEAWAEANEEADAQGKKVTAALHHQRRCAT